MDTTRHDHTKSDRQKQIPHGITYMWNLQYDPTDFPGGSVVKNPPERRLDSLSGKIAHAAEQLSLKPTTTEPVLWSLGATATEDLESSSLCPTTRGPTT